MNLLIHSQDAAWLGRLAGPGRWLAHRTAAAKGSGGGPALPPPPVAFSIEQRQVDDVGHMAIAGVARVQPVPAIPFRRHLGRDLLVSQRGVEVSHSIEGAVIADPRR